MLTIITIKLRLHSITVANRSNKNLSKLTPTSSIFLKFAVIWRYVLFFYNGQQIMFSDRS